MVGLDAKARKRKLREYSKGMQRRIGLAQALINNPELILLDEPTSGLDPIGTREIKDLIRDLREQGKTILLCSHLLADMQDICDRIAILQRRAAELGKVSRPAAGPGRHPDQDARTAPSADRRDAAVHGPARRRATPRSPTRRRRWKSCSCGSSGTTRRGGL